MDRTGKMIKEALIKASNSVRDKFRALQTARTQAEFHNIEKFKPITARLDALIADNRNTNSYHMPEIYDDPYDDTLQYIDTPHTTFDASDLLSPQPTIRQKMLTHKALNRDKRLGRKRADMAKTFKRRRAQSYSNQRSLNESDGESDSTYNAADQLPPLPAIRQKKITRDVYTHDRRDRRLDKKRHDFQEKFVKRRTQLHQIHRQQMESDAENESAEGNVKDMVEVPNTPSKKEPKTIKKFPRGVVRFVEKYGYKRFKSIRGPKNALLRQQLKELDEDIQNKKIKDSSERHIVPSHSSSQLDAPPGPSATTASVSTMKPETRKSKKNPFRPSEKREAETQMTSDKEKKMRADDTITISSGESSNPNSPSYDAPSDAESSNDVLVSRCKPFKSNKKQGSGLFSPDVMRHYRNKHVSYTYWDDPNELVDRLRLLMASQAAGHTGHVNEIASIVEELREACLIE